MKSAAALSLGLFLFGLASAPADAQTRRRVVVTDSAGTRYVTVDEDRRVRTKVIVQRRSFLDGGTEVLPGSKPTQTPAMPYGYSPLAATIEGTNGGGIRFPLPGPYDGLGKDGPF